MDRNQKSLGFSSSTQIRPLLPSLHELGRFKNGAGKGKTPSDSLFYKNEKFIIINLL